MVSAYPLGIQRIRSDPRIHNAELFLDKMLLKDSFSDAEGKELLLSLFEHLGTQGHEVIKKALSEYIYPSYLQNTESVRKYDMNTPQEIANARMSMQKNIHFLNVQNSLLSRNLPNKEDLVFFYGSFAEDALETIKRFNSPEFLRVCGIPMLAHWMRVGGVVSEINRGDEDGFRRAYSAFKHDDIETGVPLVGLDKYFSYLDEFIPKEILPEVVLLTNHYDIYLNYVKEDFLAKNLDPNKKMVLNSLKRIRKLQKKMNYDDKMIFHLNSNLKETELKGDVVEQIKAYFYENLYLPELAEYASEGQKLFIVEDKIVDLLDNDNGSKKIPLSKYIKNISKQWSMVKVAETIKSDYEPFNKKVVELKNNALLKTRYLIIGDLLEKDMTLDFIYSTTAQVLNKLKPVLYEEKN